MLKISTRMKELITDERWSDIKLKLMEMAWPALADLVATAEVKMAQHEMDSPIWTGPKPGSCACSNCSALRRVRVALIDACERCEGRSGGVPGNENIVNGTVMCDYCTSKEIK